MTESDRLRKLLEERGLSCQTHYLHASWRIGSKLYEAMDNLNGTLTVDNLTPEQAIAATLGHTFAEHLLGVTQRQDERIAALEALLKDVWTAYSEKAESSFHPAWEVDGELADRMKELGVEE